MKHVRILLFHFWAFFKSVLPVPLEMVNRFLILKRNLLTPSINLTPAVNLLVYFSRGDSVLAETSVPHQNWAFIFFRCLGFGRRKVWVGGTDVSPNFVTVEHLMEIEVLWAYAYVAAPMKWTCIVSGELQFGITLSMPCCNCGDIPAVVSFSCSFWILEWGKYFSATLNKLYWCML